jgi:hypothetical protein
MYFFYRKSFISVKSLYNKYTAFISIDIHTEENNMSNNKNGYEIRTDILAMAKELVMQEYHSSQLHWEQTAARDATGRLLESGPVFPGVERVLETAHRMYNFVDAPKISKEERLIAEEREKQRQGDRAIAEAVASARSLK